MPAPHDGLRATAQATDVLAWSLSCFTRANPAPAATGAAAAAVADQPWSVAGAAR